MGWESLSNRSTRSLTTVPWLTVSLTGSCNSRCTGCDYWLPGKHATPLTRDLWEPLVDSLVRLQVRSIAITGGEPTLAPDLLEFLDAINERKKSLRVVLLSNGMLLRKIAEKIVFLVDEVVLSLDGPNAEVHDEVRGLACFHLLGPTVAALKQYRPELPVYARSTVCRANCRYVDDTALAAVKLGFWGISFLAADTTTGSAFARDSATGPRNNVMQVPVGSALWDLKRAVESLQSLRNNMLPPGFLRDSPETLQRIVDLFCAAVGYGSVSAPRCNAPWVSAFVEANGDVKPCFFHPAVGNLHEQPFEQIVRGPKLAAFLDGLDIQRDPTCRRCVCWLHLDV